jgi:hypothetical protein
MFFHNLYTVTLQKIKRLALLGIMHFQISRLFDGHSAVYPTVRLQHNTLVIALENNNFKRGVGLQNSVEKYYHVLSVLGKWLKM